MILGRPLNKKFMGNPGNTRFFPAVIIDKAWLPGQVGAATSPVYILKQVGTSRYLVTDGTNSGVVQLQPNDPTGPGQAALYASPYVSGGETGASFSATYKVLTATVHTGGGGTGYAINDTVTLTNGIVLKVATVTSGVIATVTINSAGSRGTVNTAATTSVAPTATSGTGTGATFDLTYGLNSVTTTGGTGYTAGEQLTFVGILATTAPTAQISAVNGSGAPQTVTVTPGTNVTKSATSVVTANSLVRKYVRVLRNRTVKTWDGAIYAWDPYTPATSATQATINLDSSHETESNTYMLGNEMAISGTPVPYYRANTGVTAKQAQIFATAGVPGGEGTAAQAAANSVNTQGVFNPSAQQRKVVDRDAQKAKAKAAFRSKAPEPKKK
jgi:hypothetical protein